MLTTFAWVPKGGMKSTPIFSTDTVDQARAKLRRQNPDAMADEEVNQHLNGPSRLGSLPANEDGTVDDTDDALRDIAGGGAGAILEQVESEDEDEVADTNFKETDLVFAVAAADSQSPRLEVYTYDEPEDNLFVHHDTELAAFPLCSSWLTDGTVSMLAVGTMLPFIEIWALDVIDSVEPALVLGGCASLEHNYHKKTLKQHLKPDSHTEAVLSVRWNTVAQNILASGSADHTIKLWDLHDQGKCLGTYREAEKVQSLHWHESEANLLLSGGFDSMLMMRDCRNPQEAAMRCPTGDVVEHVEFVPGSTLVMASTSNGSWMAFDRRQAQGAPLWTLQPHSADTTFHCSRHVAGLYATGGKDGMITMWDGRQAGAAPTAIVSRDYGTGSVLALEFHPNSAHILGACGAKGEPLVYTTTGDLQPVFGR